MSAAAPHLVRLRTALKALGHQPVHRAMPRLTFGVENLDKALGGGLERAALHEFFSPHSTDMASATGLALALTIRASTSRPVVWIRHRFVETQLGCLYPPGLAEFGLAPQRLIHITARDPLGVLKAAEEAARCTTLGAIIMDLWGAPPALDLTATRRLALASGRSGVPILMLRVNAEPKPTAATTRWEVQSAVSSSKEGNTPGFPAFSLRLLRHRAGLGGLSWRVEWNRDQSVFIESAPLSGLVPAVSADRQTAAPQDSYALTG